MLNKPKFLSPSTNMPIKVVDAKSESIPFSCIIDGNEAIYAWRIRCHLLNDYSIIFDTGKVVLDAPFFPIDENNRNVLFEQDIKSYLFDSESGELKRVNIYIPCTENGYDSRATYYTRDSTVFPYSYMAKTVSSNSSATNYYGKLWNTLYYRETVEINSEYSFFWIIDFWNYTDSLIESSLPTASSTEAVFYFNDTPTPVIEYKLNGDPTDEYIPLQNGSIIDSKEIWLRATYEEAKTNAFLKRYGWRITDSGTGQILIDTITKDQIYGTPTNIKTSYAGLLNDNNYSVELYIETQNGATLTTNSINFSTSYDTTFLDNDFRVEVLHKEPSVVLDWSDAVAIGGEISGDVRFLNNYPITTYKNGVATGTNSVDIQANSSIVYSRGFMSNFDISDDSYIVHSFQLKQDEDTVLLKAEGADSVGNSLFRTLTYSNGIFSYVVIGDGENSAEDSYKVTNRPSEQVWYIAILYPLLNTDGIYSTKLIITESVAMGGLYPSATLYPSTTRYPSYGDWDELKGGN